jgi:hypothetical protein
MKEAQPRGEIRAAQPGSYPSSSEAQHQMALWFTQNLESGFSTIEVLDAGGAQMKPARRW